MKLQLICAAIAIAMSSPALAEKSSSKMDEKSTKTTKPQRANMATMHEQMAKCLRSDKPMSVCRSEMRNNCKSMMGEGACPMMSEMGGMMGRDGMSDSKDKE